MLSQYPKWGNPYNLLQAVFLFTFVYFLKNLEDLYIRKIVHFNYNYLIYKIFILKTWIVSYLVHQ